MEWNKYPKRLYAQVLATIFFSFLMIACSSDKALHTTYNYGHFSCPLHATIQPKITFATLSLHQESHIIVKWQPFLGIASTDTMPSLISLSTDLIGPFSSLDAAKGVINTDGSIASDSIVITTPPIHTDDWTKKTYISEMQLSSKMISNYYIVRERLDGSTNHETAKGSCILQIIP